MCYTAGMRHRAFHTGLCTVPPRTLPPALAFVTAALLLAFAAPLFSQELGQEQPQTQDAPEDGAEPGGEELGSVELGGEEPGGGEPAEAGGAERIAALFPDTELLPAERRAFLSVPRRSFLPEELAPFAAENRSLPLTGRAVLPSHSLALRYLRLAGGAAGDRILIVGAGGGYLATLFRAYGSTVALTETERPLVEEYRRVWEELGFEDIALLEAPELVEAAEERSYSAVIVHGVLRRVPAYLFELLAEEGVLAVPLSDGGGGYLLALFRDGDSPGLEAVSAELYPSEMLELP